MLMSVLEIADDGAVGDGGADLGLEAGDGAGLVGLDGLLHLHGLHDHDGVALGDGLAFLDDDLDDGALYGGGDGVAGGGGAGLLGRSRGLLGAGAVAAPAGGQPTEAAVFDWLQTRRWQTLDVPAVVMREVDGLLARRTHLVAR